MGQVESNSENIVRFNEILATLAEIHERKNHDYGDSFGKNWERFGTNGWVYGLAHIYEKVDRAFSLLSSGEEPKVVGEKVEDSLLDLANYAIMTAMQLEKDGTGSETK